MNLPTELAPGWPVIIEDACAHHWVGTCGRVLLVVLREGSEDDPTHVYSAVRIAHRSLRERGPKLQLLALWPATNGKPPSEQVRRAILDSASCARAFENAAAIILGQGFLAAIHRGVVTGIAALVRPPFTFHVSNALGEGIGHLVGRNAAVHGPLVRLCEQLVSA